MAIRLSSFSSLVFISFMSALSLVISVINGRFLMKLSYNATGNYSLSSSSEFRFWCLEISLEHRENALVVEKKKEINTVAESALWGVFQHIWAETVSVWHKATGERMLYNNCSKCFFNHFSHYSIHWHYVTTQLVRQWK